MARKNVVVMIDDLTGRTLAEGAGETVVFSLDGSSYEIDLDTKSAAKLRALVGEYVAAGRRTSHRLSAGPRHVPTAPDPAAVRAWAAANSIRVSDRGRIPAAVLAQFQAAGN
jgi:hypothetical protein